MTAQDILMGGGLPWVKFENIGDGIIGTIVRIHPERQVTDPVTRTPKNWKSGDPIMFVPLEVRSEEDGNAYILPIQQGSERQRALAGAVRECGRDTVDEGARIGMRFIGEEETTGANPKKLYQAGYEPPRKANSVLDLNAKPAKPQGTKASASPFDGLFAAPTPDTTAPPAAASTDLSNIPADVLKLLAQLKTQ